MKTIKGLAWLVALVVIASTIFRWFDEPRPAIAQVGNSNYPAGAIALTSSATGTTGAVVATLAASPGRLTYICGFLFTGTNATAANAATTVVVSGTLGGSLNYGFATLAAAATVPDRPPLIRDYNPCVPASGVNTAIVVTGPALGAGATLVTVEAQGYSTLER